MDALRFLSHSLMPHWYTQRRFPAATLDAIENAVLEAERTHDGEIRFVIETSLDFADLWRGVTPREHALHVFAHLRVWDTEHNNGVLIYTCLADRDVEIVADRGLSAKVSQAEWQSVCSLMEEHFRKGHYCEGSVAGVEAAGRLIARHYGPSDKARDELPNRPIIVR
jgi:uncharacterized membrane protein